MKKIIIPLLVVIFALVANPTYSQGCAEPSSDEGVTVFGYLQPEYRVNFLENSEGNMDPGSSFGFRRMRMGVMGNIPYDFGYYALLETSPFLSGDGNMFLLDAFISYNRFEFAKLAIGQLKKPLGLELTTACFGLHTIMRSEVVDQLTGPTNRDLGFMMLGSILDEKISYRLAIMNGGGVGKLNTDDFMDYYGRVVFQPIQGLNIGGSMQFGRDASETEGSPADERWRYGADIDFEINKFRVQTEYLFGEDIGSVTSGGGCSGEDVVTTEGSAVRDGFFVMGMYNITSWLQPILKYEQYSGEYDEGIAIDDFTRQTTTFGVNFFFNDWTRLQVNYLYKAEDPKEIVNDALLMQVQVRF